MIGIVHNIAPQRDKGTGCNLI